MSTGRTVILTLALVGAACVAAAQTAPTYDLRTRYRPGMVLDVRENMRAETRFYGEAAERLPDDVRGPFVMRRQSHVRVTVTETTGPLVTAARVTLVSAETLDQEPGQPAEPVVSPFVGRTVLARYQPGKEMVLADADGHELDQAEARKWFDNPCELPLDEKWDLSAARIGAEWSAPSAALGGLLGLSSKGNGQLRARFTDVLPPGDHPVARLQLVMLMSDQADAKEPDSRLIVDLKGSYLFNLTTHLPQSCEAKGTIRGRWLHKEEGQPPVSFQMAGPMEIRSTYSLVAAGE